MEKRTKLVIDEGRWLRAGKNGGLMSDSDYIKLPLDRYGNAQLPLDQTTSSTLLDVRTQRMCCLGFAACKAGVPKKHLKNVSNPSSIKRASIKSASERARNKMRRVFPWLFNAEYDSEISNELMEINDDDQTSLPYKRKMIKKIFAENGVDVSFKP